MPKWLLLAAALTVVITVALVTVLSNNSSSSKLVPKSESDTAVNQAKYFYRLEKEKNRDFSNGPCLSNALMPGWVLDIAHNPRIATDDLPENQCSVFIEGRASHFVELDVNGNLIRAR